MRKFVIPAVMLGALTATALQPIPSSQASDLTSAELTSPSGALLTIGRLDSTSPTTLHRSGTLRTVVEPGREGAIELVTAMTAASDRVELSYTADGYGDGEITVSPDGAIFLIGERGLIDGGFLPPTASDADGRAVPTHFEVDGSTVTQVIDSRGSASGPPVEARVSVNAALLAGFWKNRPGGYKYGSGAQWSTKLTTWGLYVYTRGAIGYATLKSQGWKEWVNGPGPTTATIHQQYDCHVTFGYAFWAAGRWWDLETARPSRPDWIKRPAGCNWTSR